MEKTLLKSPQASAQTPLDRQKGYIGMDHQSSAGMATVLAAILLATYVSSHNHSLDDQKILEQCKQAQAKSLATGGNMPTNCTRPSPSRPSDPRDFFSPHPQRGPK